MESKSVFIVMNENEYTKPNSFGERNELLGNLVDNYSRVVTLEEVISGAVSLDGAKAIMDCTENHVFYNNALNKKTGSEFRTSNNELMIKTVKGNFIMKGVKFSELMIVIRNQSNITGELSSNDYEYQQQLEAIAAIKKSSELKISEHHRRLEELGNQVPYIVNRKRYEKAMKSGGVEIPINSFREVRYQLVSDENVEVNPGIEKITPNDIRLLKDLHVILEHLKW